MPPHSHHQHDDSGFSSLTTTTPPPQSTSLLPTPSTHPHAPIFTIPNWFQPSRTRQPSSPQISPRTIIPPQPQPQPPSEPSPPPTPSHATHPYHNWASSPPPPPTSTPSPAPTPRYQPHCPLRCHPCARGSPCILCYRNISIADHRSRSASAAAAAPEVFVEGGGRWGRVGREQQGQEGQQQQEQQQKGMFPNLGVYLDVNVIVKMTMPDEATRTTAFRVDGFV